MDESTEISPMIRSLNFANLAGKLEKPRFSWRVDDESIQRDSTRVLSFEMSFATTGGNWNWRFRGLSLDCSTTRQLLGILGAFDRLTDGNPSVGSPLERRFSRKVFYLANYCLPKIKGSLWSSLELNFQLSKIEILRFLNDFKFCFGRNSFETLSLSSITESQFSFCAVCRSDASFLLLVE